MPDTSRGSKVELLGAFETAYGTAPDGSAGGIYVRLPFQAFELGREEALQCDPVMNVVNSEDDGDPYYDAPVNEGSARVPIDLRAFGWWLKALLGAPATTDHLDGTFTHVFTSGGMLPSAAFLVGHMALATPRKRRHPGAKAGGLKLDMARTGRAVAEITRIVAQTEGDAAAVWDADPVEHAFSQFMRGQGSIKVGGIQLAKVTGGTLEFSNNLDPEANIRDDGLIDGVDETNRSANGTVTVRYSSDTTLAGAVDAKTPIAFTWGFTMPGDEGYAVAFSLPRVFLSRPRDKIDGPGGLQLTYDWRASGADAVNPHLIRVTLTNDVASY